MTSEADRGSSRRLDERPCAFEQSILTNHAACSEARKYCVGELEGIYCASERAQADCIALLAILRRQARFALHTADERAALPYAKTMRVQIGGLRGIQAALTPDEPVPGRIRDVRRTVRAAIAQFGDLSQLPFQEIVKEIAAYQSRRRLRGRD